MPALELFVLDNINAVRFVFYFKKVLSISDFFSANILLRSTDGERSLKLNTEDPVDTQAIQSSICANFPPFSVHYQMPNLQSTIIYLNIFIALLWHLYNVSCLAQIHSGSIILNYFMFFFLMFLFVRSSFWHPMRSSPSSKWSVRNLVRLLEMAASSDVG